MSNEKLIEDAREAIEGVNGLFEEPDNPEIILIKALQTACSEAANALEEAGRQLDYLAAREGRKDAALKQIAEGSWPVSSQGYEYQHIAKEALAPAPTSEAEGELTTPQMEILHHTKWRAAGNMYCGSIDDPDMLALVEAGLMRNCGTMAHLPKSDAYFTITPAGRKVLAAQQGES